MWRLERFCEAPGTATGTAVLLPLTAGAGEQRALTVLLHNILVPGILQ